MSARSLYSLLRIFKFKLMIFLSLTVLLSTLKKKKSFNPQLKRQKPELTLVKYIRLVPAINMIDEPISCLFTFIKPFQTQVQAGSLMIQKLVHT